MKSFLLLFFMSTLFITAQTTHDLDWSTSSGPSLDLTIELGDTVRWTWADSLPHDVASTGGDDSFNSGAIQTGVGETFSYTFEILGATDYICNVHPTTMGGTITVVDNTASVEDLKEVSFSYAPN
ncbi:MAG: plastocyanin/azurin family copper-binding protein, partial [Flavobacteriaceae bacterium]|nr:plastocyanin/azurin family copper-binding protein [Flavobacteriaceae bacterium]